MYDMKLSRSLAWVAACLVPVVLFFFFHDHFVVLVAFIGAVFSGISIMLNLWIYHKIGKKKYLVYPLGGIFLLGIMLQFFVP